MKKRFFAVALATTMALSTVMTANAATADVDITAGLGTANTGDEALTGDFDVTYTFKNASHDATANWNNFAVEVFSGSDFVTMRADAFGVGVGAYADDLGTWGGEQKTTWTGQPEDWAVWAAGMADATVDLNVKRAGKVLTFTYKINAGGTDYTFVGTTPEITALADELNIHLTGEKVALSNVKFVDNKAAGTTPEPGTTAAAGATDPTTTAAAGATTAAVKPAAKTGDVAPVAALAAVAAVACAAVVVSRKKVTE